MTEFGFTKLVVGDLDAAVAYYREVYDLYEKNRLRSEIGDDAIDEVVVAAKDAAGDFPPGALILLQYADRPAPEPGGSIIGFTTRDLDGLLERVRAQGGSVHADPRVAEAVPVRVAFAKDPEGNLAEIVEFLDQ